MSPFIYWYPLEFFVDCYWCFIPVKCRHCKWLGECRKPFLQGRKCYNGCIELKLLRKQKYKEDREDYLNSLVKGDS